MSYFTIMNCVPTSERKKEKRERERRGERVCVRARRYIGKEKITESIYKNPDYKHKK